MSEEKLALHSNKIKVLNGATKKKQGCHPPQTQHPLNRPRLESGTDQNSMSLQSAISKVNEKASVGSRRPSKSKALNSSRIAQNDFDFLHERKLRVTPQENHRTIDTSSASAPRSMANGWGLGSPVKASVTISTSGRGFDPVGNLFQ